MCIRKKLLSGLSVYLILSAINLNAQQNDVDLRLSEKLKQVNRKLNAQLQKESTPLLTEQYEFGTSDATPRRSLQQALTVFRKKMNAVETTVAKIARSTDTISLGDTLVIGFEPGEELVIDSEWLHDGPILILGDGVLRFIGAHATILGDIITAENGQVIADSSYLFFPQDYFYQRILLLTGNSEMHFRNSTLDFGGLVHNMATVGNAVLEFEHVVKPDFSTVGMYEQSEIIINDIDIAGEFIVDDQVHLEIRNSETMLLWHQLGEGSLIEIEFPDGDDVEHYEFNDQQPGVSGVDYDIQIDHCTEVMWGLMPSTGSDITVSNSNLRTIGLWFEGNDSSDVSGLVNNNHYDDFTAPVADRNLHLVNTDVMTWSLYMFDDVYVEVSGCILGEIGVMGHSEVNAMNYFCDGSGGYLWAGDTTLLFSAMSSLSSSLRTTGDGVAIFAFATQMNGLIQALDRSILMLLQSNISATPTYDPGAVVWMANIEGPVSGYQNSIVNVQGSAWIDKGEESTLMDFGYYVMYYQKDGDTSWQMIGDTSYTEVRDNILVEWNTQGLDAGNYYIKIDLYDNWGNGITATRPFTLLPGVLGLPGYPDSQEEFIVYPNPVTENVYFMFRTDEPEKVSLKIFDLNGRDVADVFSTWLPVGEHKYRYDVRKLPGGIYYAILKSQSTRTVRKIIVH